MKYTISFETPYSLDAYEAVTLQERFEREIQSFIDEKCEVYYIAEDK